MKSSFECYGLPDMLASACTSSSGLRYSVVFSDQLDGPDHVAIT